MPYLNHVAGFLMSKLVLDNVSKSYGPTRAFKNGDFALKSGEVHALMGTNGSGKSTLCKIIAGSVKPDTGSIFLNDCRVQINSPKDARRLGIGTFFQELSLAKNRSVAENIFISHLPLNKYVFIDKTALEMNAEYYIDMVRDVAGDDFTAKAVVGDLRADQQQLVEILKTIATEAQVLIFDEPTSALDRSQVERFFEILRKLKAQGRAIIFISHRMDEIFEISDQLTVIRDGAIVASRKREATTAQEVISLMVGEQTDLADPTSTSHNVSPISDGQFVVTAHDLTGDGFSEVSFEVRAGEILGFGGLHGQGQSAVLRALFGANAITSGQIQVAGDNYDGRTPRAAIRNGFAYVSGNRVRDGVIQGRSIFENTIPVHAFKKHMLLSTPSRLSRRAIKALNKLATKYHSLSSSIGSLSGGNQQKVVIARWLMDTPRVLLLDDPTKGIDLSAKADLFALIRELASEGLGIILYSSEDAELLNNSDRILVFNSGRAVRELSGENRTRFNLYDAAYEVAQ